MCRVYGKLDRLTVWELNRAYDDLRRLVPRYLHRLCREPESVMDDVRHLANRQEEW